MRFCQPHWTALRAAIDARGLSALVADDGETAARNLARELHEGTNIDNFDPLMSAHWAIVSNVMDYVGRAGGNPLYLMMADGPEDPVEGYGDAYAGRTWPRCPLCYLGLAHEVSCTDERCELPKVNGFDWMIDRAADDAAERWRQIGNAP